jgi:hypothetical protein
MAQIINISDHRPAQQLTNFDLGAKAYRDGIPVSFFDDEGDYEEKMELRRGWFSEQGKAACEEVNRVLGYIPRDYA